MLKTGKPSRSVAFNQILRLLDELNSSSRGSAIFQHIAETFDHLDANHFESESQYTEVLELLFGALAEYVDKDSSLQTDIYILTSAFVPPLPSDELARLKLKTKTLIQQLAAIDIQEKTPSNHPMENTQAEHQKPQPEPFIEEAAPKQTQQERPAFNLHLSETSNNVQHVKNKLNDQLDAATRRNNELAKLLKESMEAVRQIDSQENANEIRLSYMRRYVQLFKEHQDLATHFDDIRNHLNNIEFDSQHLDDEFTRAQLLGLTDELTQLPNRRALMERLDDEVARVQRYGGSLALAIVDMDEFKPINDNFGHDVGDTVLKHFASTALSVFRHHDTVARYGGEEFAILMPNTELEGARCALKKIQTQLGSSNCHIDGDQEIKIPTFSGGIALYKNGETADSLIKRADAAMYRAKQGGKNRIEVDAEASNTPNTIARHQPHTSPA